jgi:hypothetical protein
MKVKIRKHKKSPAPVAEEQVKMNTIEVFKEPIHCFNGPGTVNIHIDLKRIKKNALASKIK